MKLLGLIGGVSPESTAIYYRLLNDAASERLGPEHSANLMLYTLDYGVMIKHYDARDWDAFKAEVVNGATRLKLAGVAALIICSNTTHVAADAVAQATGLPVIHLLDALSAAMKKAKSRKPLLLGTPVVMGEAHYRRELAKRYDGEVSVPAPAEQDVIGRIILDELVRGEVLDASRQALKTIVGRYDCDGVILGCTELCMILSQRDFEIPAFDTTGLHAAAASAFAFGEA